MQPNEVLSLCFHFLCPDKETAHPIRLGRIRVHWSLEDEGLGFKTSENYEPSERWVLNRRLRGVSLLVQRLTRTLLCRWLACSEMECPYVTVLRPDLAVDLEVPLQAKVGAYIVSRQSARTMSQLVGCSCTCSLVKPSRFDGQS